MDEVIDRAAELGLWVALLPTWGDKVGPVQWGVGPEVFTVDNARAYGAYLGARYRDRPIIWMLGGDRIPDSRGRKAIWRAMAGGLREGDRGRHLITYHPQGVASSSLFFPDEPWLDFHTLQSCHLVWDRDNYNFVAYDYGLEPPKPCMDSEPNYEDMPVTMRPDNGYFGAYDARKAAYWALFAGAHRHTYGANGVFQFWDGKASDIFAPRLPWHEALDLPGAAQMGTSDGCWSPARSSTASRTSDCLYQTPIPAPTTSEPPARATGYALIYSAAGLPFTVDAGRLSGSTLTVHWYDPRLGPRSPTAA